MNAAELGAAYDRVARWWEARHRDSDYGVDYVDKAIRAAAGRDRALDVGCGCGGRIIDAVLAAGYRVLGVDVSPGMLAMAAARHPGVDFVQADFMAWQSDHRYDLVIAWDSIFHAPCDLQEPAVAKLCGHLAPAGVLVFTAGGMDGDITGEMNGVVFGYGSLSCLEYLRIIRDAQCEIITMESDQPRHMVFLCRKKTGGQADA